MTSNGHNRERRSSTILSTVLSRILSSILAGALALIGGVSIAVLYGGFAEVGRSIVRNSPTIQEGIGVVQERIEEWIKPPQPEQDASKHPGDVGGR